MVPIHRLKIIIMPKWIVFIPKAVHTGRKIGVKIRAGRCHIHEGTYDQQDNVDDKQDHKLIVADRAKVRWKPMKEYW